MKKIGKFLLVVLISTCVTSCFSCSDEKTNGYQYTGGYNSGHNVSFRGNSDICLGNIAVYLYTRGSYSQSITRYTLYKSGYDSYYVINEYGTRTNVMRTHNNNLYNYTFYDGAWKYFNIY